MRGKRRSGEDAQNKRTEGSTKRRRSISKEETEPTRKINGLQKGGDKAGQGGSGSKLCSAIKLHREEARRLGDAKKKTERKRHAE